MDTGSTCALLSEPVWNTTKTLGDKPIPWNGKPLYLADEQPRKPLGLTR